MINENKAKQKTNDINFLLEEAAEGNDLNLLEIFLLK